MTTIKRFNLSKTEFTAYLECSLKFYLLKQQNQQMKEGPRRIKDHSNYPTHFKKGLKEHRKLREFYKNFADDVINQNPTPDKVTTQPILRKFWEQEVQRYQVDPNNWYPLAHELYLATDTMRGQIDRVDPLSDNECRIVEYKSSERRSGFLNEELLFYALLATESQEFKQTYSRKVSQVGCYFYDSGEWFSQEVTTEDLSDFKVNLENYREQMLTGDLFPRADCHLQKNKCSYAVICTKVPDKMLKKHE